MRLRKPEVCANDISVLKAFQINLLEWRMFPERDKRDTKANWLKLV